MDRKKVLGGDEAVYEYRWGSRAEKELGKRQVLQFVSEVLYLYLENPKQIRTLISLKPCFY